MFVPIFVIIIIFFAWIYYEEKRAIKLAEYLQKQKYEVYLQELEIKNLKQNNKK